MTKRMGLIAVVGASIGCGGDAEHDAGAEAVVRESAGVTIVENPAPADLPAWRLSDTASVVIGEIEGPPEYQLERVLHAARLSDGRIVIADAGALELRFFSASGAFLGSSGGEGGGPGEFESIRAVFVDDGDTIRVWDPTLRRFSVFGADGEFARSFMIDYGGNGMEGFPSPVAVLSDGRLLVRLARGFGGRETMLVRDTLPWLLYSALGERLDTVAHWVGAETFAHATANGMTVGAPAFGRETIARARGDEILVGDNERYEIRVHAGTSLRHIIRLARPARPVSDADIANYREALSAPGVPETFRARGADMPFPQTMPAFADFLVDHAGNVWVQDYRSGLDEGPRNWTVFDRDGRAIAAAATPADLRVTDIGEDWVLGIARDDLDVQQVRLYPLQKTE